MPSSRSLVWFHGSHFTSGGTDDRYRFLPPRPLSLNTRSTLPSRSDIPALLPHVTVEFSPPCRHLYELGFPPTRPFSTIYVVELYAAPQTSPSRATTTSSGRLLRIWARMTIALSFQSLSRCASFLPSETPFNIAQSLQERSEDSFRIDQTCFGCETLRLDSMDVKLMRYSPRSVRSRVGLPYLEFGGIHVS